MKKVLLISVLVSLVLLLMYCNLNDTASSGFSPTPYEHSIPNGFPNMLIAEDNPTTEEGVQLGRMLYYDPIIDSGNVRTCGQCHAQKTSFACEDACLPHINLVWNNAFLWNGEVRGVLENIMLFEVEKFFKTDLNKLNANHTYAKMFYKAFGVDTITTKEIAYALAQFVRTLISSDSKYDRFIRGEVTLTDSEIKGYQLFFSEDGDCFHCHGTILLTDNYFHNNGLDSIPDQGRAKITGKEKDVGKFKTPTLRNIEFTAPYMHDGRYKTLEEVIDFYGEDLNWSPTIDPLMKKVHTGGVQLNKEEKTDLITFLKTFSDTAFINNPDFADPFLSEKF